MLLSTQQSVISTHHFQAMPDRILITMDDIEAAVRLNAAFEAAGFITSMVAQVDDYRAALKKDNPDLVLLSGALHEPPARQLAHQARETEISTLALLESTDTAHHASDLGVTEVMVKPVETMDVLHTARRLIERRRLQQRTGIAGESPAIQEVLVKIEQMAPVSSTVLVQGESGTGKELVAKATHDLSPRRGKPFIAVNCAALPESLLESELFGHEKGAFTGAAERRLGRFELADEGTIFLDEIGEIPSSVQVKLLRVLESRIFFRVGGTQPIKVDVRVVAATNQNLKESVAIGKFRDDLYYRLNVLNIYLPPLRERREDIPLLIRRFVREFAREHDRSFRGVTPEAMRLLSEAPWPGNVRQLRNLVESMVVLAPGHEIRAADIPPDILEAPSRLLPMRVSQGTRELPAQEFEFILRSLVELRIQVEELRRRLDERPQRVQVIDLGEQPQLPDYLPEPEKDIEPETVIYRPGMTMADVEKAAIAAALEEFRGNRRKAADVLGIGERTLYRKIKAYNLG